MNSIFILEPRINGEKYKFTVGLCEEGGEREGGGEGMNPGPVAVRSSQECVVFLRIPGYMRDPDSEQGWITSVMGVLKWRKSSHDHQAQVVVQVSVVNRLLSGNSLLSL